MKKLLGFGGVVVCVGGLMFCGCGHGPDGSENVLINSGFDDDPWDNGWTVITYWDTGYAGVTASQDTCYSSPHSCLLSAEGVSWYDSQQQMMTGRAGKIEIYQEFNGVSGATCRFYSQFDASYDPIHTSCRGDGWICVKVNGDWVEEIPDTIIDEHPWKKWEKVYKSTDVVSGIKFGASASPTMMTESSAYAKFWVDGVYVGKK